ncbi:MAG: SGNH/GDSL hydrolase family protein [Chloroflexota bacterium]
MSSKSTQQSKLLSLRNLIRVTGVVIVLGLLLIELLPITSAGIGPLQWIGIGVGVCLFLVSFMSLEVNFGLLTGVIATLITLLVIEGGLAVAGYEPDYTWDILQESTQPQARLPYWTCDPDSGCRYIQEQLPESSCEGETADSRLERVCLVNEQGFPDDDNFVVSADLESADYRVMLLGDSFTWGAIADVGSSYAEVLQAELSEQSNTVVWNFGIPGTGTTQALSLAQEFMPIMNPDLVILGFYSNDFYENLFPLDLYERFDVEESPWVYAYVLAEDGVVRLSDQNIYLAYLGRKASTNNVERLLRLTRFGSLLVNAWQSVINSGEEDIDAIEPTQSLLAALQETVEANGAELLILHIPDYEDMATETETYTWLTDIVTELAIPRVDVIDYLEQSDYIPPPDGHWNNSGHEIVGRLLATCVLQLLESDAVCDAQN